MTDRPVPALYVVSPSVPDGDIVYQISRTIIGPARHADRMKEVGLRVLRGDESSSARMAALREAGFLDVTLPPSLRNIERTP